MSVFFGEHAHGRVASLALYFDNDAQTGLFREDASGRLGFCDTLRTAVDVSLFTRRRHNGEGGHWADTWEEIPIGSRLWTLQQERITPRTLNLAREYIKEALDWMIIDGIASSIDVEVWRVGLEAIGARVSIYRPDGGVWQHAWEEVGIGAL